MAGVDALKSNLMVAFSEAASALIPSSSNFFLTHSRRDLFKVFDIGCGQIEGIIGIILAKEFFKKSN